MNLLLVIFVVGIVKIGKAQDKIEENVEEIKQVSLSHNRKLMDYLLQNTDDVVDTIHKNGPGSTELLSQVAGATLTSLTQAWFRCSKKFGISRDTVLRNFREYISYTNENEACSMSCLAEESRLVSNGKLDRDMVSLSALLLYGDDQDIHKFFMDTVEYCRKELPSMKAQTCRSAEYFQCFFGKAKNAGLYTPYHILEEFSSPYVMELTA